MPSGVAVPTYKPNKQSAAAPQKPPSDAPPPAPPRIALRSEGASFFRVGNYVAPGILRQGAIKIKRSHDVDKKKGGGTSGANITTNGEKPIDVTITLTFWDGDCEGQAGTSNLEREEGRLYTLIGMLFPDGGKAPTPFDCYHPMLTLHRLRALFFEDIDGPDNAEPGVWTYTLKATDFRPPPPKPKSATSTPGSSKGGGPSTSSSGSHSPSENDQILAARKEATAAEVAKERAAWKIKHDARLKWLKWQAQHTSPASRALAAAGGDYGPPESPDPGPPPGGWPNQSIKSGS